MDRSSSAAETWESEHWDQLQQIFHQVETVAPEEREIALNAATDDPLIRDRVLQLLQASSEESGAPLLLRHSAASGTRIGPYAVERHLGTGGLGSVYLCRRSVGGSMQYCAVKVLSMHAAGPAFLGRFQREQQILASLNHPGIARLLDAGTADTGEAYLVMEYVDGADLTAHCDDQRLSVQQRLHLFLELCDVVSYAHRNLTVHLDLKPSNILLTKSGHVKLLDFGAAKLLDPDGNLTTTIMATPAYSSPEQLRGEAVTTSCDLYSLGAVLFELLSGQRPFQGMSMAMVVERALKEQEPSPVTQAVTDNGAEARATTTMRLRQSLQGDLATIVARCLRSHAADRYASVDALAEDVRRHLAGQPVLARPQTQVYRMGKFVRRNRFAVTAAALAGLAVVSSLSYGAVRQHQALRAAQRAVQMQTFMSQLFKLANTNYMGKPAATVPEFLQMGARVLPVMIQSPDDQRSAALSLAESMYNNTDYRDAAPLFAKVSAEARAAGDVAMEAEAEGYAGITAFKLGDMEVQRRLAERALQLSRDGRVPASVRVRVENFYVLPHYDQDRMTDADVALEKAAYAEAHSAGVSENDLAFAALSLGQAVERGNGDWRQEESLAKEALAIYQREPWAVCEAAGASQVLGFLLQQHDDLLGSVDMLRTSYEGYRQCSGDSNRDTLSAGGYLALAMVPAKQTRLAIPLLEEIVPKLKRVAGEDSIELRAPLLALARSYLAEGEYEKSQAAAEELLRIVEGKVNPHSGQFGAYESVLARALSGQQRYREALVHAQSAERSYQTDPNKLPATVSNAAKTHQLVLDLQSKLSGL